VKSFVAHGGYRLYPVSVEAPESACAGKKVEVSTSWENIGWGYCPANIPQWNQKYKVGISLLDETGNPVKTVVEHRSDLSTWLREKGATHKTSFSLKGVKPGKYRWAVALVDTTDGNRPSLEMAVDKNAVLENGWLPCGEISIYK